jgi:hypothetical protein
MLELTVWTHAPLSCFGSSGSLPIDPLAALGIFPRAGAVFERLAPFVIRKLALHRRTAPEHQRLPGPLARTANFRN